MRPCCSWKSCRSLNMQIYHTLVASQSLVQMHEGLYVRLALVLFAITAWQCCHIDNAPVLLQRCRAHATAQMSHCTSA